jgi:hypothetical protein
VSISESELFSSIFLRSQISLNIFISFNLEFGCVEFLKDNSDAND